MSLDQEVGKLQGVVQGLQEDVSQLTHALKQHMENEDEDRDKMNKKIMWLFITIIALNGPNLPWERLIEAAQAIL